MSNMKKVLFLILVLFLISCTTQKITSEKVKVYNIYGQKIIEVKSCCDVKDIKLDQGIYYIQYIDDNNPYWTKEVRINL